VAFLHVDNRIASSCSAAIDVDEGFAMPMRARSTPSLVTLRSLVAMLAFAIVATTCVPPKVPPKPPKKPAPTEPQEVVVHTTCANTPASTPAAGEVCAVTPSTSGSSQAGGVVVVGDLLLPGQVIEGGGVSIESDGTISCVGCDCANNVGAKTLVVCPDAVVSPGLINAHDHAGWMNDKPWVASSQNVDPKLRWDQRNDWRKGLRGYPKITVGGGANDAAKALGEFRGALGGMTATLASGGFSTTSIGSGGVARNLDDVGDMTSIGEARVDYETFPLGDTDGTQLSHGCAYPGIVTAPSGPFAPHIAEGVDDVAHNEIECLTSTSSGGKVDVDAATAIIHGIALLPSDVANMAKIGASLIWSPRSNVSLYGDTAEVPMYQRLGVNVALGTDWLPSGSMNLLRELQCAENMNAAWGAPLTDQDLWRMVTINAAVATGAGDALGLLAPGRRGDVAVFKKNGNVDYAAVTKAGVTDVALVLKDGKPLVGDANVVKALDTTCDDLDVCSVAKQLCASRETGSTLAVLTSSANGTHYPLFACDTPLDEPSCIPLRELALDTTGGSSSYSGVPGEADSDGDGVPDSVDNCPHTFNPIRPLDHGKQADADGDGVGDACDPCPLDANTDVCPNAVKDSDGDGVPDDVDNCPTVSNADQKDSDGDGHGDACDACPHDRNPGNAGCPATIVDLRAADPASVNGTRVDVGNVVVTANSGLGFFVATTDPTPACAFVSFPIPNPQPAPGSVIALHGATVTSTSTDFELENPELIVTGSANVPAPALTAPSDVAAAVTAGVRSPLEACLIRVENVAVTNATPPPGPGDNALNEFEITGGLRVDDFLFTINPQPSTGASFTFLQGPLRYTNALLKMWPRNAADVGVVSGP
jgi:cytosine/adenosine deaminase-related metal-dependent hydrolase